ncbi:MAG: hypothetical protein Q7J27_10845 [Syntrophales bacterium]|nr:hypothetical protein [Syntrophales bacterium]
MFLTGLTRLTGLMGREKGRLKLTRAWRGLSENPANPVNLV